MGIFSSFIINIIIIIFFIVFSLFSFIIFIIFIIISIFIKSSRLWLISSSSTTAASVLQWGEGLLLLRLWLHKGSRSCLITTTTTIARPTCKQSATNRNGRGHSCYYCLCRHSSSNS